MLERAKNVQVPFAEKIGLTANFSLWFRDLMCIIILALYLVRGMLGRIKAFVQNA